MKNDVISPEFDENGRPLRRIRSFVRRQGITDSPNGEHGSRILGIAGVMGGLYGEV